MSAVLKAAPSFTDPSDRGYPSLQMEATTTTITSTATTVGLKEFLRSHSLPCFAKVSRGSSRARSSNRDEEVYLHCVAKVSYVVADEMSVVHRKHIQPTSQRFYVPLDCRGWFEVLSQDGISARPFGSVADLAKLAASSRCLVRQSIGGHIRKADGGYDTQIIRKGDVLTIFESLWISGRSNSTGAFNKQLLRCTDQRGQELFLDLNQRGLFSPVAGNTNVTGAHSVKSLLTKFRLPVMVRLLYGNISPGSGSTYSTGVFKLMNVFSDEIVFILPTKTRPEDRILPVPTRAKTLKLRTTHKTRDEMIPALSKHCKQMVNQHLDTILSIAAMYESSWLLADIELEPVVKVEEKKERVHHSSSRSNSCPADPEEEELFREIDSIYNSIANPIVPRPIVFTTESAARNNTNGLRRNMTAVAKVKTVQLRSPSSAQKTTRVIDDNWQMLSRELVSPVIHLQTDGNANGHWTEVQIQKSPKHEKVRRRPAPTTNPSTNRDSNRGEHLYEEIPFFLKTDLDDTGVDTQKSIHISNITLSYPETPHGDTFDPVLHKPDKPDELRLASTLTIPRSDTAKEKKTDVAKHEATARRKRIPRPKSFAGTPFTNELELAAGQDISIDEPPPPLPPKRGESMCNLRDDLNASISPTAASTVEFRYTPTAVLEISSELDPQTDDTGTSTRLTASPVPSKTATGVDRRPSSKVSSAVKTLGNVSRSFFNTFRKIGGRSSATLVINNLEETTKQQDAMVRGGSSSKESVARSSPETSPEPEQAIDDELDMVAERGISVGAEESRAAALQL